MARIEGAVIRDLNTRTSETKEQCRERLRGEVLDWYLAAMGFDPTIHSDDLEQMLPFMPKEQHVNTVGTRTTYHLEPLIPNVDNVMLIEEEIGGIWTIRLEKMAQKVSVFL